MITLSRSTKRLCVIIGIIVAVACVGYGFALYTVLRAAKQTAMNQAKITQQKENGEKDRNLVALMKQMSSETDALATRVISSDGTVSFIESVEALGREAGVSLIVESVKVGEAPNKEVFETLALSVEVQGSWSNLHYFLALLEKMPYKLAVSDTNFARGQGSDINASKKITASPASGPVWSGRVEFSVLKQK